MAPYSIPFNRASLVGPELELMREALAAGKISGDGVFSARCHELLERELGAARALLTPSCTHALELAALLIDTVPGDEVIVPSFTFVSSANAFVLRGARPVFVDSRPDTLNLDERLVESAITERTRAIVCVHYAGVACEMDRLSEVARRRRVALVEDNAHGLFGSYRGKPLGSFGDLAALSFHETKNFTCGEGGALLVNRPELVARAEVMREKGTDRSRFFRGEVDKYTWVDVGSSYLLSDLLAAFLLPQLEAREAVMRRRREIWEHYRDGLEAWADGHDVRLPVVPAGCGQAYHMFYLLLPSLEVRQRLIGHLAQAGILAVFHYLPLHLSAMGRRFGSRPGDCPVAEAVSDRLLRLPFYTALSSDDQGRVIERVREFSGW
jgi:dTDP-4-amino-4,6-dideoxygalactose transaminase